MNLIRAEITRALWRRVTWGTLFGLALFGTLIWTIIASNDSGLAATSDPSQIRSELSAIIEAGALVTAFGGFLWGASMIGAESNAGSLGNWLTFVPNRNKVFWSKSLVVALGAAALGFLMLIGLAVTVTLTEGLTGLSVPVFAWLAPPVLRGVAGVCAAALLGYALAMLFGSTAAAPIAVGAYGMVFITRGVFGVLDTESLRWAPETAVHAFLAGGADLTVWSPDYDTSRVIHISAVTSALYLGTILAVVLGVSWWWFRRRDIT